MFTFCFFRRRTENKKVADLEHIVIEPQTPTRPKPAPPASTSFGTTVVGEYIPEDSISFVQRTNPANPVDDSLESTVAPSKIQEGFSARSASGLYEQLSLSHLHPIETHCNITMPSKAANTSNDIHQPVSSSLVSSSLVSVAVDQLTEITNRSSTTSSQRAPAINRSPEMANQQPATSRPRPIAINELAGPANYEPAVAKPHYNLTEAIMDLSQPVVSIPQTPAPSEAARQRSLTNALRILEGEPAMPYWTTGFDWRNYGHLGSRDPSLLTVKEELEDDDMPLADLGLRLPGQVQEALYIQSGPTSHRNAGEAREAATHRRRAKEEAKARHMAIHAGNLPNIATMNRMEETARQGQFRPRGTLLPNARREKEAVVRKGLGWSDKGPAIDAADAAFQRFTAQDMRAGTEERQRQGQLQMRFYGGLPQDAHMVGGAGDEHKVDTRGSPPPMDDFAAFQEAAFQRESAADQERELRRQTTKSVEYRHKISEERRERIRGEGVTDTRLTDFDVDAVNHQAANQPPRLRQVNAGRLDGS